MKKMMLVFNVCLLTVIVLIPVSCKQRMTVGGSDRGDTLELKHSKLLTMVIHDGYTEVKISNPWHKGSLLHTYILVDKNRSLPADLPSGTVVRTPLEKSVVFTTAHASLLGMIGAGNQIGGVADLKYMLLPDIKKMVAEGRVADCGDAMSPNIEEIVDMGADAVLLSPFDNSGGYGRVEEIGIPIIECADYMELSALARAEWMKFYGMLYGRLHEAESLYDEVCREYVRLKALAKESDVSMSMITEKMTGSVWYVAGGKSSVGQLIVDANGKYAFSEDKNSGSIAMSFEKVLDKAGDADVWVFNHYSYTPMSYSQLEKEHHGYKSFKAFKTHNIYYVNSSQVPYFEEVSFRPDYLLRDFIILLHPDLARRLGKLRYYRKVVE